MSQEEQSGEKESKEMNGEGGNPVDGGLVLKDVLEKVQAGDASALPALRKLMDEVPEIASTLVNLTCSVESRIVREMARGDLMMEEAMPRVLREMKEGLAGENPSPLEKLLVESIALCWLELQYFETVYAQDMKNMPPVQGDFQQKRIDRVHRRYLSSIKTLAQIRKMGPAVQINIAEQQVNTVS